MLYCKEFINHLKESNPYPERIFGKLSDSEIDQIVKLLEQNGFNSAIVHGDWGRKVWNNCISNAENYLEAQGVKENWIDVDYRVPEIGQKVIFIVSMSQKFNQGEVFIGKYMQTKNYAVFHANKHALIGTHWMPIPELPLKLKEPNNA